MRFVEPDGISYTVATTSVHPQLRSLISINQSNLSGSIQLITTSVKSIGCHELHPPINSFSKIGLVESEFDHLGYDPTCLIFSTFITSISQESCSIVIAGGAAGELSIKKFDNQEWNHVQISQLVHNINNSLTVKDDTLYVSNNGNSIFIFKIVESNDGMSLNLVQSSFSIKLPSPVNHTSISPNGQWLLAVTDTPTAYLFTLSQSNFNNPWILHQKISESKGDASFSTAWAENSNKFAIGSQCGTCNVYNLIDGQVEKIVTLRGRGAGAWGAIRKVNFFKIGSVELLAFSEHRSIVQIYNTSNFNEPQILTMPASSSRRPSTTSLTSLSRRPSNASSRRPSASNSRRPSASNSRRPSFSNLSNRMFAISPLSAQVLNASVPRNIELSNSMDSSTSGLPGIPVPTGIESIEQQFFQSLLDSARSGPSSNVDSPTPSVFEEDEDDDEELPHPDNEDRMEIDIEMNEEGNESEECEDEISTTFNFFPNSDSPLDLLGLEFTNSFNGGGEGGGGGGKMIVVTRGRVLIFNIDERSLLQSESYGFR